MGNELEKSGIIRNNRQQSTNGSITRSTRSRSTSRTKMRPYDDSPSDEWTGYNSDGQQSRRSQFSGGGHQQQQMMMGRRSVVQQQLNDKQASGGVQHYIQRHPPHQQQQPMNQYQQGQSQQQVLGQGQQYHNGPHVVGQQIMPGQQQYYHPHQVQQQRSLPRHPRQINRSPQRRLVQQHANPAVVSHFMKNHPSMQQGGGRNGYQNDEQHQQSLNQHTQPQHQPQHISMNQQPQQQQYQQYQNQPNWNEVNQLHRDFNRQRHYAQRLRQGSMSRQQYQEYRHQQQQVQGEESIVSVSEQARKFEKELALRAVAKQWRGDIRHQQGLLGGDDETISVASLRKGWEQNKQQQRTKSYTSGNSGSNNKHTPTSRSSAGTTTSTQSSHHHNVVDSSENNNPFGVWEERANRLSRLRRREQRREQRKNIEDRWKENFRHGTVKSLPPPEKKKKQTTTSGSNSQQRHYESPNGYRSEGEQRGRRPRLSHQSNRYDEGGYQSEGQELVRRGRGARYHEEEESEYHHPPVETGYVDDSMEQGLEIEYDPDNMVLEEEHVVYDAITPQDARRRLWDQQERLRAVLPREERADIGDVRDRWIERRPPEEQIASPGRSAYSGSSGGQGRFKSKFVHAAAIATQQRDRDESYSPQRSLQQRHSSSPQRAQVHTYQQHQHRPQKREVSPYKKVNMTIDSGTATTMDMTTTTPSGSFGSSHRNSVRKVSPSPPKHSLVHQPNNLPNMPPIAEQRPSSSSAAPPSSQAQTAASVAELISRINAVSRSNPEEALAAIDSIIKRESCLSSEHDGNNGETTDEQQQPAVLSSEVSRDRFAQNAAPPQVQSFFSPTRDEVSPIVNKARNNNIKSTNDNTNGDVYQGKDFFQQQYEEVLHNDSLRVLREANADHARHPSHTSFLEEGQVVEDEDDENSLLSSEDSTVSSMTDPTYQSERPGPRGVQQQQASSHEPPPQPPDLVQQKSWNTLRRDYYTRKASPVRPSPVREEHREQYKNEQDELDAVVASTQHTTPSDEEEDIGLDKFCSNIVDEPDEEDEDLVYQRQPQTLSKSDTNDISTGMCGMMTFTKSGSKSRGGEESTVPQANLNTANSNFFNPSNEWVSHEPGAFGNANNDRRRDNTVNPNRKAVSQGKKDKDSTSRKSPRKLDKFLANDKTNTKTQVPQPRRSKKAPHQQIQMTPPRESDRINPSVPKARASTPEIMMAMSNAFSNVDINLEVRPSQVSESRPILGQEVDEDPPLQVLESSEGEDNGPGGAQSLQTISEAFSDVDDDDVFGQHEKSVSQRRKELEYLAKSWTASKSQSRESDSSSSFKVPPNNKNGSIKQPPPLLDHPADWTKTPKSKNTTKEKKKMMEPTLRLKGNKSLAKKFASLVKAYDD